MPRLPWEGLRSVGQDRRAVHLDGEIEEPTRPDRVRIEAMLNDRVDAEVEVGVLLLDDGLFGHGFPASLLRRESGARSRDLFAVD